LHAVAVSIMAAPRAIPTINIVAAAATMQEEFIVAARSSGAALRSREVVRLCAAEVGERMLPTVVAADAVGSRNCQWRRRLSLRREGVMLSP